MDYVPHQVTGRAAEAVSDLFYLGGYQPEHQVERLVPDGKISLVIELDGQERFVFDPETGEPAQTCKVAWLSGVQTEHVRFSVPSNTELMAVRFKPGRARPVLHMGLGDLTDEIQPASEALGNVIVRMRKILVSMKSPAAKLKALNDWLNQRWQETLEPPEHIVEMVGIIENRPTLATVTRAFKVSPHSHRHTVNQFRDHVGVVPKVLQRILRFCEIFPKVVAEEDVDWAAVADECGYFDQPHLSKDFAAFSGLSPARFKMQSDEQGNERLNFFPSDD